jgi:hypothetical protein
MIFSLPAESCAPTSSLLVPQQADLFSHGLDSITCLLLFGKKMSPSADFP